MGHGCCDAKGGGEEGGKEGSVLCVAVLRPSGREVDVFDAKGNARSFAAGGGRGGGGGGSGVGAGVSAAAPATAGVTHPAPPGRLCFSTHGLGGRGGPGGYGGVDGLLTPCFDENGEHGEPEEGCFCGVDTPHLHAHVHDPERCDYDVGGGGSGGGCGGGGAGGAGGGDGADLRFLAQLTLHPTDEDDGRKAPNAPGEGEMRAPLLRMPVNESLPKQCNAKEFTRQLSQHGMEKKGRRMYKVQHEDHFDYLFHNDATGDLHLEHPCKTCGDTDLHGKFHLVHRRSWRGEEDERRFRLHFFEAAKAPFSILDVLSDLFSIDSDRARAVRCDDILCEVCDRGDGGGGEGKRRRSWRGSLKGSLTHGRQKKACADKPCCHSAQTEPVKTCAKRSCCASAEAEPPCSVPPDKPLKVSTDKLCCSGGARAASSANVPDGFSNETPPTPAGGKTVRSQLFVAQICCASEIPAVKGIVEPLPGVSKVLVNAPMKTVHVDHDPAQTAAADVEAALNKEGFGALVRKDGGASSNEGTAPRVGRSQFFVEKICCASEIPAIRSIVEPLPGVCSVSINVNVTSKMVYVDHNVDLCTASDIAKALNDERFGAHVKKDAGQALVFMSGLPTTSFVETILSVKCSGTESDVQALGAVFETFPEGQIRNYSACGGVDMHSKSVKVEHNPFFITAAAISESLCREGIESLVVKDGAEDGTWALGLLEKPGDTIEKHVSKVNPFVIVSGVCWVVSMFSYIGGNWEYLKYVGLGAVVFGIPPIAIKSYRTLRRFQFDANCMMLFAAIGAVALQEFTEAAAVTFLFAISESLETRATARARNALSGIVNLRPDRANLVNPMTKEIVVVPAAAVAVGSVVSVRTGDKIPCDGVVIEGNSTVDESSLTGESRPVRKGPKDTVSGGTINSGLSQLLIKTSSTVDNSAVARLIRLVEEAQANRSPTEKLVDEFAKRYTPVVVLAAVSMCTIPWAWGKEVGREWVLNGLITMVIACPCALIISTPVTYVAGLAATAQKGIIVKGGSHLEALGRVKKIAFDKTGTLTEGNFALLHLNITEGRLTRKEVLEYLALMEAPSSHPLASALVAAAKNEGVSIPKHLSLQNHTILKGEGVTAIVNGSAVHVGNSRLFRRLGLFDTLPETDKVMAEEWAGAGGTVGYVSIEGVGIVGAYSVADAIRPESRSVVDALERLGIDVNMLTGDGREAALAIGNQVGLTPIHVHSDLLPENKLELISEMLENICDERAQCKRFRPRRNVLMCGDGVNDAPALAMADVGVAMGAGAALAMETSDVTLMDSNLKKLLFSIKMGKRVVRTIIENVTFSLVAKAVVMGFTFAGKASLWAAIASDVGAMLVVTLNGMKLLPSKKKANDLANFDQEKERDNQSGYVSATYTPPDESGGKFDAELVVANGQDCCTTNKGNRHASCCEDAKECCSSGACGANKKCCDVA